MSDPPLIYEKDYARKRALITFNRPERMNAMSPDLIALLARRPRISTTTPTSGLRSSPVRANAPSAPAPI